MINFLLNFARREKIRDGLSFSAGAEGHALVHCGKKPIGPITGGTCGHAPRIRKHHVSRKIIGLVPQSVGNPRTHHRKAVHPEAATLLEGRGGMA